MKHEKTAAHGQWQRIVIKIGSALIAPHGEGVKTRYLLRIAEFIVECRSRGIDVVLVSSGSVAAGRQAFKQNESKSVARKKAMAATGQMALIAAWQKLFDFPVAQLLLTQFDFQNQARYESVQLTANELLEDGILPIVNENDAVSTDEMRVGDNDNLSAVVAAAVGAQCLIICSDVDGLYDKNPSLHADAELIKSVSKIDSRIFEMAGGPLSGVGTGGMTTKLEAALKATENGIATYIVNGTRRERLDMLLDGGNPGTFFEPAANPLKAQVHWLRHASKAKGEVIVSEDIVDTIDDERFCVGSDDIVNVVGSFSRGDTILVKTEQGKKLAKATSHHSSCLLNLMVNEGINGSAIGTQSGTDSLISESSFALLEDK